MSDRILWLDLETDGVDVATCSILEVGLVVTEGIAGEEIDSFAVQILEEGLNPLAWPDEVFNMHLGSGLLRDIRTQGVGPGRASNTVRNFVEANFDDSEEITFGGSGIDRFDLPILRGNTRWAWLADRAHFRTVDVSSMKHLMRSCGLDVQPGRPQPGHRAVDDARWAWDIAARATAAFLVASGDGS